MAACPRLFIVLALGFAPGCLSIHGTVTKTPEPAPAPAPAAGDKFASLRPGESIPSRPVEPKTVVERPATPKPPPNTDPIAPLPPEDVLAVKGADPGPFPLAVGPPVPEPPLLAAMRAYVENRPDDAIRHLEKLEKPNQEFALAVMPVLARGAAINLASPDPQEAAHLVEQLTGAAARLEPKAALKVEKVAFCKRANGFGRYDPWPEAQPYRPNDLAVLYVEVRNMGSTPSPGPAGEGYLSRAVVSLEVRDAKMNIVEQTDPADYRLRVPVARFEHADHTRSPLRDYSRTYRIKIPPQPGVYTVTVEVRDPATGRSARSQPAEFRVAGP
ncbi:MAG TPA: hypothetical protein VH092_34220 [Urbifossiella sp.]|jgi:hypothetical protein|nr:hypothetical protein [Urbifossiella sp.]